MLSGALIDFFLAGSTTPDAVYANPDLDESLGVTVTCDSGGLPTSDGNAPVTIWRGTSAFRVRLRRADGTTVWDLDDQAGAFSSASIQSSRIVGERIGYVGSTLPNSQWCSPTAEPPAPGPALAEGVKGLGSPPLSDGAREGGGALGHDTGICYLIQ